MRGWRESYSKCDVGCIPSIFVGQNKERTDNFSVDIAHIGWTTYICVSVCIAFFYVYFRIYFIALWSCFFNTNPRRDECLTFVLIFHLYNISHLGGARFSWSCRSILNTRVRVPSLGDLEIRVLRWNPKFYLEKKRRHIALEDMHVCWITLSCT